MTGRNTNNDFVLQFVTVMYFVDVIVDWKVAGM